MKLQPPAAADPATAVSASLTQFRSVLTRGIEAISSRV
jgi:hypothetical protein